MNHKVLSGVSLTIRQKLGHTLLGAGIMAVGITIGQVITPDIDAQSNGMFGKVICREFEVVDKDGNKAVVLGSKVSDSPYRLPEKLFSNHIAIYNPLTGKDAVLLTSSSSSNNVWVRNHQRDKDAPQSNGLQMISDNGGKNKLVLTNRKGHTAIELSASEAYGHIVWIHNPQTRDNAIIIRSDEYSNYLDLFDRASMQRTAFRFSSNEFANTAIYYDREVDKAQLGKIKILED